MYIHGRFVRKMGMFKPCSDAFIKVSHYCPIAVQPLAHALRAPPAAPTGDVFAAALGGTGSGPQDLPLGIRQRSANLFERRHWRANVLGASGEGIHALIPAEP